MICLREAFGVCSKLKIVMLDRRQTIFLTPSFQFEKRSDFLLVYVTNTRNDLLCLPSWHHGKQSKHAMETSWNFIIRFLWNPGENVVTFAVRLF